MKVTGFLELFAFGIHEFMLRVILNQVHFSFHLRFDSEVLPMLVFYVNLTQTGKRRRRTTWDRYYTSADEP